MPSSAIDYDPENPILHQWIIDKFNILPKSTPAYTTFVTTFPDGCPSAERFGAWMSGLNQTGWNAVSTAISELLTTQEFSPPSLTTNVATLLVEYASAIQARRLLPGAIHLLLRWNTIQFEHARSDTQIWTLINAIYGGVVFNFLTTSGKVRAPTRGELMDSVVNLAHVPGPRDTREELTVALSRLHPEQWERAVSYIHYAVGHNPALPEAVAASFNDRFDSIRETGDLANHVRMSRLGRRGLLDINNTFNYGMFVATTRNRYPEAFAAMNVLLADIVFTLVESRGVA